MDLPEIIALISGVAGLLVALATVVWYLVQSGSNVKQREFGILRETVETLHQETRRLKEDLRAAEKKIADLEAENASLRERVGELETENRQLRAKLKGSPAG